MKRCRTTRGTGADGVTQTTRRPSEQKLAELHAKLAGKSEEDAWARVKTTTERVSDMMHALRVRYDLRREKGEGDPGALELFQHAAYVATEALPGPLLPKRT